MNATPTRGIMIKVKVTMADTGYPAPYKAVQKAYGKASPCLQDGLWWVPATPRAYASIMKNGLDRKGTVISSFVPPGGWPEDDLDDIKPTSEGKQ